MARVPRREALDRRAVRLLRGSHRLDGGSARRRRLRGAPEGVRNGMSARPIPLAHAAREAVSCAATASRALSGRGYVADDVRKRLLAAADRLGYVPNLSARTLKQ